MIASERFPSGLAPDSPTTIKMMEVQILVPRAFSKVSIDELRKNEVPSMQKPLCKWCRVQVKKFMFCLISRIHRECHPSEIFSSQQYVKKKKTRELKHSDSLAASFNHIL